MRYKVMTPLIHDWLERKAEMEADDGLVFNKEIDEIKKFLNK